ncbi:fimbrillin family protein [Sphingobacterium sp. BIGb0165]|uniref:fimbrillin family protein n=1 Tax=Sphingobacterium sp. BIGb0165 TaxID=2940615 RepID=UPI00216A41B3|nr:fimbrillin family protein [Sphingobacterium sp. BIGb0165]MCS4226505.1 hypothetical protein [Sphingobacterium sp. BIGb0165]
MFKNIYASTLALVGMILIQSCSKEKNELGTATESQVSFMVDSETGFDVSGNVQSKASNIEPGLQWSNVLDERIVDSRQNVIYNIKQEVLNETKPITKAVAPVYPDNYAPAGFPAGRALTKDVTFRILLYNNSGSYVSSVDGVVGSSTLPQLPVVKGNVYRWYAYSYYGTDPLPAIASNELQNPKFPVENEDFLFASGTFTAATGPGILDNKITVKFKHAMTMIEVGVHTGGFNAKNYLAQYLQSGSNRPSIQAASNILQGGKFDLKAGSFDAVSTYTITNAVDINRRANYATSLNYPNTSYHGFFFTVPGSNTTNNFKFNISSYMMLDYSSASDPLTAKILNKSDLIFTIDKTVGKFNRITIMPMDAGIIVPGSPALNWARGDIYYDAVSGRFNDAEGYTRFQHRPRNASTYFYPSTYSPNGVSSPSSENYGSTYYVTNFQYPVGSGSTALGNPCNEVRPNLTWPDNGSNTTLNSSWTLPTVAQGMTLATLINNFPERISYNYNSATRSIVVNIVPNGGTVSDDWSQVITFELKGYAQPLGVTVNNNYQMQTTSIPYKTNGVLGGYGYFWLAPGGSYTNSSGQTVNGYHSYLKLEFNTVQNKIVASVHSDYQGELLSGIKPFDVGITPRTAMPIRCVRARLYGN